VKTKGEKGAGRENRRSFVENRRGRLFPFEYGGMATATQEKSTEGEGMRRGRSYRREIDDSYRVNSTGRVRGHSVGRVFQEWLRNPPLYQRGLIRWTKKGKEIGTDRKSGAHK